MRKSLFVLLLLLMAAPSLFAQDWRDRRYTRYRDDQIDFTPFIGYRYGGRIYADQSTLFHQNVDVNSAMNFGLNLGIPVSSTGMKIELLVDRQNTNFTDNGGIFGPRTNLGDFNVTYYQAGILIPFNESRAATPYVAITGGLANLDPAGSGASSANRFAASAAIGVKVPLQRNLALRVEERGFFTSMNNYDRCGGCYYSYNHDLYQGETNVGLDFKF